MEVTELVTYDPVADRYIPDGQEEKEDKPSQADLLVDIGLAAHLFIDQYGVEYARAALTAIPDAADATDANHCIVNVHSKKSNKKCNNKESAVSTVSNVSKNRLAIMPLHSSNFKEWLAERMHTTMGKTPGSGSLNSAVTTLSGIAHKRAITHSLYNRVAPDPEGNGIWVDMCDKNWRAIHVTEEDWQIVDEPPILFRRFSQKPLAVPIKVKEGREATAALKLLEFLNLKNDVDQLIFICSIISYFIPEIEHPILSASGPHGAAKSMLFELSKKLVDPLINTVKSKETETISMSKDENGLAQQLHHVYFPCFDNVSSLEGWQSDMLCRAVTGGAILKRKLYTDDEDIIYQFHRCVGLNGINVPARNSDLLDRTLLFNLEEIKRKKEKLEILADFERERPYILGGMLSVVSKAIKNRREIKVEYHQRLTDFHRWGCAIAQALGYTAERFNEVYAIKVSRQNEEALSASSVATALLEYLKENLDKATCESEDGTLTCTIEMTPTELYDEVTKFANMKGMKTSKGYWSADVSHFSRDLNKVLPNLERVGVLVVFHSTGTNRLIIIDVTKIMSESEATKQTKGQTQRNSTDQFWDNVMEDRSV